MWLPGDVGAAAMREWRQFRLLARDSVRSLINSALFSQESDPAQYALWTLAGAAVAPAMYAVSRVTDYAAMGARLPPDAELVVMADRMFFVLYAMLASALLAARVWDALLPDAVDQEVIGPLPVRPRTLAVARLGGAAAIGIGFALAIAVPSGILFAATSATHPVFGSFPSIAAAHLLSMTGASLFTFGFLLLVRALVAAIGGPHVSRSLALLLQLVVSAALVGTLFFLPAVLSWLVQSLVSGEPAASRLWPPLWFTALYTEAAGGGGLPPLTQVAWRALAGLAIVGAFAAPAYVLPAALISRRIRESRGVLRSGSLATVAARVTRLFVQGRPARSLVSFTILSLTRSRRHLLLLAMYAGAGLAIGAGRLASSGVFGALAEQAADSSLLVLPLVLMLFLLAGLRSACATPTEIDGNWIFRLATPSYRTTRRASLAVMIAGGVGLPIMLLVAAAGLADWPFAKTAAAATFDLLTGLLLAEIALWNWAQVPCARTSVPSPEGVKTGWLKFCFLVVLVGFVGSHLQAAALTSRTGILLYAGTAFAAFAGLVIWQRTRPGRLVTFDAFDNDGGQVLGLSEALD